jgi:hypothetical protein
MGIKSQIVPSKCPRDPPPKHRPEQICLLAAKACPSPRRLCSPGPSTPSPCRTKHTCSQVKAFPPPRPPSPTLTPLPAPDHSIHISNPDPILRCFFPGDVLTPTAAPPPSPPLRLHQRPPALVQSLKHVVGILSSGSKVRHRSYECARTIPEIGWNLIVPQRGQARRPIRQVPTIMLRFSCILSRLFPPASSPSTPPSPTSKCLASGASLNGTAFWL